MRDLQSTSRSDTRSRTVARRTHSGVQAVPASALLRKPSCACGGGCPQCQKDELRRKAQVSMPGDRLEREADDVADQVMRMAQPAPVTSATNMPQREVQREGASDDGEGLDAATALHVAERGGDALPADVRDFFEPRFGQDFGSVRVHHDSSAAEGAQAVKARAYTVGRDIVFGAGEFAPSTDSGRRLLAHELTHVVQQQGGGKSDEPVQRQSEPDPAPAPAQDPAPAPAPAAPAPAPTPGPTLMLAKPPHLPQTALSCWASAIASWNRVKGLVGANVTDKTLIDHYKGTDCIDKSDALIGDSDADVEAVFGEWRLSLSLASEVADTGWTFGFVKTLIEQHGHFVVVTGDKGLMHAMVVYGVRLNDKSDPTNFTVFVEDPLAADNEKHAMFFERPIRIALGTGKSSGPAPCRKKKPRTEEEE